MPPAPCPRWTEEREHVIPNGNHDPAGRFSAQYCCLLYTSDAAGRFSAHIELFAVTLVLSLPLGLVVSFGTMSRFKPLSLLVRLYVYIMRSTPLMLQLAVAVSYTHLTLPSN